MTESRHNPTTVPADPSTGSGALLLGIDTGGTYTDAVLYDERARRVVAKAKASTTHDDLSIGITGALRRVLDTGGVTGDAIAMVSLSTTLATNALVESKGRPACLVSIGFDADALDKAGIGEAMALGSGDASTVVHVRGGHNSHGQEVEPLDEAALRRAVAEVADDVDAFAVTAQFSVRNPAHEERAAAIIAEQVTKPVTQSHRLSAKLNGPRRAVTALLNARLISMVDELVATTERTLHDVGIAAPLMVVRGNGSLVAASFVRARPIETILSGPAASLVGAAHLVDLDDALVADIGGTTTDIAVLTNGAPRQRPEGAVVGGHRTMVDAVEMFTHGLGGDSDVRANIDAEQGFALGPRRVVPVCLFAEHHPELVIGTLERQVEASVPSDLHGRFARLTERGAAALATADRASAELLERVAEGPMPVSDLITTSMKRVAFDRLVDRGHLQIAAFTPTDASHVLGDQSHHDPRPAFLAGRVLARQRDRFGNPLAERAEDIARLVVVRLERASAQSVLAAAFAHDGLPPGAVADPIVAAALDRIGGSVPAHQPGGPATVIRVGLALGLVGLGAPASTYYPGVGALLGVSPALPDDADVANAIGAVVGRVTLRAQATISAPRRGLFRLHLGDEPETFYDLDLARDAASVGLRTRLGEEMTAAGAGADVSFDETWEERTAIIDDRPLFVEGVVTVTAAGRPEVATASG